MKRPKLFIHVSVAFIATACHAALVVTNVVLPVPGKYFRVEWRGATGSCNVRAETIPGRGTFSTQLFQTLTLAENQNDNFASVKIDLGDLLPDDLHIVVTDESGDEDTSNLFHWSNQLPTTSASPTGSGPTSTSRAPDSDLNATTVPGSPSPTGSNDTLIGGPESDDAQDSSGGGEQGSGNTSGGGGDGGGGGGGGSGLTTGAKIGIGVAVGSVTTVVLVITCIFIYRYGQRKEGAKRRENEGPSDSGRDKEEGVGGDGSGSLDVEGPVPSENNEKERSGRHEIDGRQRLEIGGNERYEISGNERYELPV